MHTAEVSKLQNSNHDRENIYQNNMISILERTVKMLCT